MTRHFRTYATHVPTSESLLLRSYNPTHVSQHVPITESYWPQSWIDGMYQRCGDHGPRTQTTDHRPQTMDHIFIGGFCLLLLLLLLLLGPVVGSLPVSPTSSCTAPCTRTIDEGYPSEDAYPVGMASPPNKRMSTWRGICWNGP